MQISNNRLLRGFIAPYILESLIPYSSSLSAILYSCLFFDSSLDLPDEEITFESTLLLLQPIAKN